MNDQQLPAYLAELADIVVPVLRRVYDINSLRHDPHVGDDAVTFASATYRNSWYQLEQAFAERDGWITGRPDGSLTITNGEVRLHVYRCGPDEYVNLDSFRLDDAPASLTKRSIAAANSLQLTLDLFGESEAPQATQSPTLRELVIIHAGNPDDGCCGIWVGAPMTIEETTVSPWAWIESLWLIDRPEPTVAATDLTDHVRHDELPEPDLDIQMTDEDDDSETGEA